MMNLPLKKVSIIIPVFNGANYLAEAIDSALNQSYKNIEILVINDGSKDDGATDRIAKGYGEKIRYFHKKNGGVASALNLGIEQMTGDYFSWLSHDDLYYPNKVATQIQALENLTQDTIIYSNYEVEYVNQHNLRKRVTLEKNKTISQLTIATSNNIHGCTLLIPATIMKNSGGFREDLRTVQDYDLWYRLSKNYNFYHIGDYLVVGRVHEAQVTNRLKGVLRAEVLNFRSNCFKEVLNLNLSKEVYKSFLLEMVNKCLTIGFYLLSLQMVYLSYQHKKINFSESIVFLFKYLFFILKSWLIMILVTLKNLIK